jgi:hypothetical protein
VDIRQTLAHMNNGLQLALICQTCTAGFAVQTADRMITEGIAELELWANHSGTNDE